MTPFVWGNIFGLLFLGNVEIAIFQESIFADQRAILELAVVNGFIVHHATGLGLNLEGNNRMKIVGIAIVHNLDLGINAFALKVFHQILRKFQALVIFCILILLD